MTPDRSMALIALLASTAAAVALAQNVPDAAPAFPADAQPLAAEALKQRLADKVFEVKPTSGGGRSARIEFRGDYVFADLAAGGRDTGRWRIEASSLCVEWQRRRTDGCAEMRAVGDALYLQRANGEVVQYLAR